MILLDTDICIALRDLDADTWRLVRALEETPVMSMISRIELENGIATASGRDAAREARLAELLTIVPVEMFTHDDLAAYRAIVLALRFDRQRTLDRLIAAQAIARDVPLVTRNGRDFRRIAQLRLMEW